MLPRAVFFDMDDTLLNTSGGVDASWQAVCDEFSPGLGCESTMLRATIKSEMQRFWSDEAAVEREWRTRLEEARVHVLGLALTSQGLDLDRAPQLSRRYWEENSSRMRLFDDALETLTSLRGAGFQIGLITNGPAVMQRWKIAQFALEPYFDVMVIEGEFGHGKPSPKVFEHALAAVGAGPHEAWHVGDNLYADIAGAQSAGIHAAWIHRDRLEMGDSPKAIPDRVIAHLDELRTALGV